MKISLNWLQEYIKLPKDLTAKQLAHDLTMATVEVEEVTEQANQFTKMVVGKVIAIKNHSNADKLKIAMTDIGKGNIKQIVCGGTNLFEGMLVAVALPGAKVRWHGEGDYITLEKTKIRGEESYGMICASTEIGLGEIYPNDEKEILNISFCNKEVGIDLAQALNSQDTVLEIDNKSLTNRPDLWSHYGIARELAAIYKTDLKPLEKQKLVIGKSKELKINIKSKACRRYLGVVIDNIKVEPSPDWIQQRLITNGMRPINNIVDLTNYVMLEIGEPMHAFDYNNVADAIIVARMANTNEILTTLEGDNRKLDQNDLVIADGKKAQALAGIKGGAESGISDQTTKIIIEAANFDPIMIRKTTTRLNFRTDASQRHEKNLDLERPEIGLARFLFLLKKILPQIVVDNVIDQGENKTKAVTVKTNREFIISRLGQDLTVKEIDQILSSLGFLVKVKDEEFEIKVPHWRATGDVSIPEDIVEEVGRIYGYDNLDIKPLKLELGSAVMQSEQIMQKRIKTYLSRVVGLSEIYSYPWSADRLYNLLGINKDNLVKIAYPPAEDLSNLQNSLLPNLLKAAEVNGRFKGNFGLFEMARVFKKDIKDFHKNQEDKLNDQPKFISALLYGEKDVYFRIKGAFEGLMEFFNISNWQYDSSKDSLEFLNNKDKLNIKVGGEVIGYLGSITKSIIDKLDIKNTNTQIVVFELDLDKLLTNFETNIKYQPLPQFPSIERDLAMVLDYKVKWGDIEQMVYKVSNLIKEVKHQTNFDLEDKQSVAFRIIYYSEEKTLTSEEVEIIEQEIIKQIGDKFGGELRK